MEQVAGFPKNLAYNLKRLEGSIIKQKIVINSDKSTYGPNENANFGIPLGRMIDDRTITAIAKCSTNNVGNYFPRGGLNSLIEALTITCNSKVIQSTNMYNYIWNCLADASGYFSQEQSSKRLYENFDPSLSHTNVQGEGVVVTTNAATTNAPAAVTSYYYCINQWLGWFSSSAATKNTNDFGQILVQFRLAPQEVLWLGCPSGTNTGVAVAGGYKVEEFTLSMDTITFTNSLYNDLVMTQLQGAGLNIAYNDYLVYTGSAVPKSSTGITQVAQFSTNSLDAVFATFRVDKYNTQSVLALGNAIVDTTTRTAERGSTLTYYEILANPVSNEGGGIYGGFNNSIYFQRAGGGIESASWYINSQPFVINTNPIQIYNNLLQTLDFGNIDIASGGINNGAITSGIYNRCFFLDALSLENISGDGNNWVSGLGGNGGIINVQYTARFKTLTNSVIPIIIGKVSKIMNVKYGRNIDIME